MKKISLPTSIKIRQGTAILLIAVLLAAGWHMLHPAPAWAAPHPSGAQTAPTPVPETAQPGSRRTVSPVVGILVLLGPALFLAWKSRGKKAPEITASCCLPVIDESKRPFQMLDDEGTTLQRPEPTETNRP